MVLDPLGARLNHNGSLGTVRYVGAVEGTTGTWLGVEWDDPARGKHSGKEYFTCQIPGSGSFIRNTPSINWGCTFLEALLSKYVELPHASESPETVILGSSNGAIAVEAVGLDKVRMKLSNVGTLREISLNMQNVATPGPSGEIAQTCPYVRGLDLSQSLIPSWEVIAAIAGQLHHLETLTLNSNRFQSPLGFSDSGTFSRVTELRLNNTLLGWHQLLTVLPDFPVLSALELGYNRLSCLSVPSDHALSFPSVRSINLDSNFLASLPELAIALGSFPQLERLLLTSNHFENIPLLPREQRDGIRQLKHLTLTNNRISKLSDFDTLNILCPELLSLNVSGNPVFEAPDTKSSARQLIIARMTHLTSLDFSSISRQERKDSEVLYLSHVAQQSFENEDLRSIAYPRWRELCEEHGRPSGPRISVRNTLGSKLITLQVISTNSDPTLNVNLEVLKSSGNCDTIRVLPTMGFKAIRFKVLKTLKYTINTNHRIWLWLDRGFPPLIELDETSNDRDAEWLGLENGSILIVQVK
ncbi:RNI-like protein, partial [Sistotremastrum niveocremeum HHB9708]